MATNPTSFPEMYERWLVRALFRPWAEATLDELALTSGDRVLDVACGTGVVARLAAERVGNTGAVVGVDINPQMLAVARALVPGIDWRAGSATALPLQDAEQFSVVVCQQGLQFFADRMAAAREMRRALAAGGRLAVSTWRPDEEIPLFRELRRVAEHHLGAIEDLRHSFGHTAPLESLLRDAGLRDVRVRTRSQTVRFADAAAFARLNTLALTGMSAASRDMSEESRSRLVAAIVSDSATVLRRYTDSTGLAFEISANVATASG
jgi:ubiquinone/menaquinone biosynthesis C-methylase UbiE